jgi:malate dehydrogenase (oxaloacetate-decarboxylating)
VPDALFQAAALALAELAPSRLHPGAPLYPGVQDVRRVARHVAQAVARTAQQIGVAPATSADELEARLDAAMWQPEYPTLRHTPSAPAL